MPRLVQISAEGIIKITTLDTLLHPVGKPHWARVKHAVGSGNNIKFTNIKDSAAPDTFVHEREFEVKDITMDLSGTAGTIPVSDKAIARDLLLKYPEPKIVSPTPLPAPSTKFAAPPSGTATPPVDTSGTGSSSSSSTAPTPALSTTTTAAVPVLPSSAPAPSSVPSSSSSAGSPVPSPSSTASPPLVVSPPPVVSAPLVGSGGGSTSSTSSVSPVSTTTTSAPPLSPASSSTSITSSLGGPVPSVATAPISTSTPTGPAVSFHTPGASPAPIATLPVIPPPVIPPSTTVVTPVVTTVSSEVLKPFTGDESALYKEIKRVVNMVVDEKWGKVPDLLQNAKGEIIKNEMRSSLSPDRKTLTLKIPTMMEGGGLFSSPTATEWVDVKATSQSVSLEDGRKFNNAVFAAMVATACEHLYKKQGIYPLVLDLNLEKLGITTSAQKNDFENKVIEIITNVSSALGLPNNLGLQVGRDIMINYVTTPAPAPTATPPGATPVVPALGSAPPPGSSASTVASAPLGSAPPPGSSASTVASAPPVSTVASPLRSAPPPGSSASTVVSTPLSILAATGTPPASSAAGSPASVTSTSDDDGLDLFHSPPSSVASTSAAKPLAVPTSTDAPVDPTAISTGAAPDPVATSGSSAATPRSPTPLKRP